MNMNQNKIQIEVTTAKCAECDESIYIVHSRTENTCSCGNTLIIGGSPDQPILRWNTAEIPVIQIETININKEDLKWKLPYP